jgi:hypothetical protein
LPESVDDVYTLVGSTDIRKARDSAIENLETLIDKVRKYSSFFMWDRYF